MRRLAVLLVLPLFAVIYGAGVVLPSFQVPPELSPLVLIVVAWLSVSGARHRDESK